ncbi:Uma2 family endonuclease [uncultured Thiothrix sp.]|uniref:Uma2 family endonuclease n=1 Tax=uncultured Thiothrix sp. TaxID=223185 RepID=UPI0026123066|nr:Uma2 family endonuclease [uncultured Thiothrix sp.]HMT93322.1 Uma2 family endonuclease [Thiolinea sp.]
MEWSEVIHNPFLKDLPFKIELNKFGKLLMSPASNSHGRFQGRIAGLLWQGLPDGEVITECSVQTSEGVKVADVAWASAEFIAEFAYATPYLKAPEICVEIVSPSNSKLEISEKVDLYLAKGAKEVWVVYLDNRLEIFSHVGLVEQSIFLGDFKEKFFNSIG